MPRANAARSLVHAFLGSSPSWYKATILAFLAVNPLVVWLAGPFVAGWLLVGEFILTLAMALRCYPLQPGGLLAIEAVVLGMTSPEAVYTEVVSNVPVLLLLMFMVAGIHFLQDLLVVSFTQLLLRVRSKLALSLVFCGVAALLSAFLDALTVIAVVIAVAAGFYGIYHRVASGRHPEEDRHDSDDSQVAERHRADLDQFRAFLRNLVMHAAVGTALGGALTLVGEPQNLLIGKAVDWHFVRFFLRMAPVTVPVLLSGLATCLVVERFQMFGYGATLPQAVRTILEERAATERKSRTPADVRDIVVQAVVAALLLLGLAFHVAEIGLIGLVVLIVATALQGVTEEHRLGRAFTESLPFTALLVVFFAVVAVIHEAHLFEPILGWALSLHGSKQLGAFYVANAALSIVSDNVFVATVYVGATKKAMLAGQVSRDQLELLAVAINAGTNLPSVATPNGQAGFLFLLTSALAPRIRLSYGRMMWLALPYAIVLTLVGFFAVLRLG